MWDLVGKCIHVLIQQPRERYPVRRTKKSLSRYLIYLIGAPRPIAQRCLSFLERTIDDVLRVPVCDVTDDKVAQGGHGFAHIGTVLGEQQEEYLRDTG